MPKTNNIAINGSTYQPDTPMSTCIEPLTNDWLNVVDLSPGDQALKGPSGSVTGWSSTANSVDTSTIGSPSSFTLSFEISIGANEARASMIGLGQNETSNSYQGIEYAFYIYQRGTISRIYVYESGTFRGLFFDGANGDINGKNLQIVNNNGSVEYYIDGSLVFTSPTAASGDYYVDNSWYYASTWNGTMQLENISICQN